MTREYFPTGFTSWTAFYQAKRNSENRKAMAREAFAKMKLACCIVGSSALMFGALWLGAALDFVSQH